MLVQSSSLQGRHRQLKVGIAASSTTSGELWESFKKCAEEKLQQELLLGQVQKGVAPDQTYHSTKLKPGKDLAGLYGRIAAGTAKRLVIERAGFDQPGCPLLISSRVVS